MTFYRKTRGEKSSTLALDVVLSQEDVVQPDLIFVSNDRSGIVTEKNMQGVPDLVVEIVSESSRRTDEIIKRKLYERAGVAEYWVIDPVVDTTKIHRRTSGGFERAAELSLESDDELTTPLLPGFTASLSRIFPSR